MTFGEKLNLLRKQNHLSQEQLAAELDVSRQTISKWELNSSFPDIEKLKMLRKLFGVSIDYLLIDELESDEKISEAVKTENMVHKAGDKKSLTRKVISVISLLGILILCIVGSVYFGPSDRLYPEIGMFIRSFHLRWLVWLLAIGVVQGIGYFEISVKIKNWWKDIDIKNWWENM